MSNQKLQTSDLLLVNRAADSYKSTYGDFKGNVLDSHIIQSPTPPTEGDTTVGTIWVNTSQDPPVVNIWDGTQWTELQGGAEVVDPDRTTDISFRPTLSGGTGTANDPFLLTTVTCFTVGGTVNSVERIYLENLPATAPFFIENLSGDARFTQPFGFTDNNGKWDGELTYTDTPDSTTGETYEALFNIGSECYIKWTVIQIANQTPIVGGDGTTSAPNASPGDTDIGGNENLYGTGTGTWADNAGTLRTVAVTTFSGQNDAIIFGVNSGSIDATDKYIDAGDAISVQFDAAIVAAAAEGETITGALTNDDGFYQEWSMTKDVSAVTFTIAPLVDQALSTAVLTGAGPVQGVNAPAEIDLVAGATLTDVEVSVAGGAFTSTFPASFNPGDTLQLKGTTGAANDTEYTATVSIGSTQATWSVTTTDAAATIPQPTITLPVNGSDSITAPTNLVSDAYQDNGTGAGSHASSTWEVYESDASLTPQTSEIIDVDDVNATAPYADNIKSLASYEKPGTSPDNIFDGNPSTAYEFLTENTGGVGLYVELHISNKPGYEDLLGFEAGDTVKMHGFHTGNGDITYEIVYPNESKHVVNTLATSVEFTLKEKPNYLRWFFGASNPLSYPYEQGVTKVEVNGVELTGDAVIGNFTTITFTNNKTYNAADNSDINVTIDEAFKRGDKVVGENVSAVFTDTPVFSATTYSGNDGTQTVETGIDNTDKALIWIKSTSHSSSHSLTDTVRGFKPLSSDASSAQFNTEDLTSYNDNGFTTDNNTGWTNTGGREYVAWNFRAAPGFFDIVAYTGVTGDSNTPTTVKHELGSEPGVVITKKLDGTGGWQVYHKELGFGQNGLLLNSQSNATFNSPISASTATTFDVLGESDRTGENFIAYLFADTPGVIKCGKYTGNGNTHQTIDCGFDAGWLMIKSSTRTGTAWRIMDVTRGLSQNYPAYNSNPYLRANEDSNEPSGGNEMYSEGTNGFRLDDGNTELNYNNAEYVYIAISADAVAGYFLPTGILTEDADKDAPSMTLKDVTGTWVNGLRAVNESNASFKYPAPTTEPPGDAYTQVVDAVDDTTNLTSYPLTSSELNDDKSYHARVKYKDDTAPDAIESEFSNWSSFSTDTP